MPPNSIDSPAPPRPRIRQMQPPIQAYNLTLKLSYSPRYKPRITFIEPPRLTARRSLNLRYYFRSTEGSPALPPQETRILTQMSRGS